MCNGGKLQYRDRGKTSIFDLRRMPIGERKQFIVDALGGQLVSCIYSDMLSGRHLLCPLFQMMCILNSKIMRDYDVFPLDLIEKMMAIMTEQE